MRRLLLALAIVVLLVSWTIDARSESILSAEIGPQPLADALTAFARQSGLQIMYVSDLAAGRRSKGARAGLSPSDALTQLLEGTGLAFELLNARTVKIFAVPVAAAPAAAAVTGTTRSRWHTAPATRTTDRIVVTASRSASHDGGYLIPAEDVRISPSSVTVLDGDGLATQKLDQVADYTAYLPGVSLSSVGVPSDTFVMVRGIYPLTEASSVVYYIDDTPVGSSGQWGLAANIALDLVPFDLDRLELLRGPQGTSYGAAAEAGILRYVFKEPSVSRFEARVGADLSTVHGAAEPGASIQAVVNAPVVDERLAVRVNAYDSSTPGYIDNAYTGAKDVNELRRNGGRIAALWLPSNSLSMKVTAFWDRLSADSAPEVSSAGISTVPNTGDAYIVKASRRFGDLTENQAFLEPVTQGVDYYAATVRWNAGSMAISSATAWSNMATRTSLDYSAEAGTYLPLFSGGTITAGLMRFDRDIDLEKFTEEVRIASSQGRMEWSLGAFYNHENTTDRQVLRAFDTSYHPIAPFALDLEPAALLSTFEAIAFYGETTWNITDRLDLTGGIRHDHDRQEWSVRVNGAPPDDGGQDSDGVTTWTAAARYRIAPDVMVYGRAATGFRPTVMNGQSLPTTNSETLTSYEAGLKSEFLDHRALFDVSVFYIDWTDIQLGSASGATINGAQATSQGGELISSYSPLPGLTLGFDAAFTQCEFTDVDPAVGWLLTGYQVPQVPKWSMVSSADFDWMLSNTWHAHLGGSLRWIGRQWGVPVQSRSHGGIATIEKPSYSVLDLNAGIAKERLAIKVFARNLLDTRAMLHNYVSPITAPPTQENASILQPRTIGIGFEFSL